MATRAVEHDTGVPSRLITISEEAKDSFKENLAELEKIKAEKLAKEAVKSKKGSSKTKNNS